MIEKKIIALVVTGGMLASIGLTAGAYTKTAATNSKVKAKSVQEQRENKGNGMMEGRHGKGNFNPADMQKQMKTKLDTLVTAGTINQATEDAVIANFNKIYADRKAEMDKVKAMTEAERKTYFDSKVKTERVDPLSTMVKAGTLTQAQADAIKKLMPGHQRGGKMHRDRH